MSEGAALRGSETGLALPVLLLRFVRFFANLARASQDASRGDVSGCRIRLVLIERSRILRATVVLRLETLLAIKNVIIVLIIIIDII